MTDLDVRYGRTKRLSARDRAIAFTVGIGILVAAVLWVWWVSLDSTGGGLSTRDIGHTIVDDSTVSLDFEVSTTPGTPVRCAIEALNGSHAIVGWRVVDLPPAATHTTTHRLELRTSERATTGLVSQCWLP